MAGDWVASIETRWSASMKATFGLFRRASTALSESCAEKPSIAVENRSTSLAPLSRATAMALPSWAVEARPSSTTT